jgi:hypothetical protein
VFDTTLTVVLLVAGIVLLFTYTDDSGVPYRDGDVLGVLVVVLGTAALLFRREGHGLAAALDGHRPGHGLLGMRERVALYGGSLHVGPRHGGGFEVRARIPFDEVAV